VSDGILFLKKCGALIDSESLQFKRLRLFVFFSSGTFGMEAVARQFATDEHVMVIRNGWFSFR
jgi:aspartate aminotransferase-like enzyme